MLLIDRLWEILDLETEMEGVYRGYQTVSGFAMTELNGLPSEGEQFEFHHQKFEIIDMDGRRIDKVLVTPQTQEETPPRRKRRAAKTMNDDATCEKTNAKAQRR